jgi:hypothetical protein
MNLGWLGLKIFCELKLCEFTKNVGQGLKNKIDLRFSLYISFLQFLVQIVEFFIEAIIIYFVPKAFLKLHLKMIESILGVSFYDFLAEKMIGE